MIKKSKYCSLEGLENQSSSTLTFFTILTSNNGILITETVSVNSYPKAVSIHLIQI